MAKTVIITGSARGLGYEMAKVFINNAFNVVLSDINETNLSDAVAKLQNNTTKVIGIKCDVSKFEEVEQLWNKASSIFKNIDIWINNAGVNQPQKYAWELTSKEEQFLINVDLQGTINGTKVAINGFIKQGYGDVYNVEGFGSNDAYQPYLVMYGTTKRAVTYYSIAIAKEIELINKNIHVGRLSPGIMITSFLTSAGGNDGVFDLADKTKRVYNILGDYPDVIARYLVKKMIKNKKNNYQISWLTNGKAFRRFMFCWLNKRDFFQK